MQEETGAKRANVTRHRSRPHEAQVSVKGQRGIILVCTCHREKKFFIVSEEPSIISESLSLVH